MAHEFETRQQAEELYVIEGLTLDQVAARVQVPARTVDEWSRADGWVAMRKEYRRAQGEIRRQTMLYRLELLKKGMETLHPQNAFAWATVEAAASKSAERGARNAEEGSASGREIKTPEDAINALQEAIQRRLNGLLSAPDAVNLKAIRELRDGLAMVDDMKTKYRPEERQKGLSDDTIRTIEKEVLGLG